MVNGISDAKAKVLERMRHNISEQGVERMDISEMETLSDIVKDLAEAEYYCTVTDAMTDAYGYSGPVYAQGYMPAEPMGYYGMPTRTMPYGYDMAGGRSGYRDSMGRYASRPSNMGYDGGRYGYDMQGLRDAMTTATAEEREKMQRELRTMLGM